jgi:hypothetical protein
MPPVAIGDVVRGGALPGPGLEFRRWRVGDLVTGLLGCQDYCLVREATRSLRALCLRSYPFRCQ